jgi:hypothetical protein
MDKATAAAYRGISESETMQQCRKELIKRINREVQ